LKASWSLLLGREKVRYCCVPTAALQLVVHGYFLADLAADVFRQGKVANDALASRFPGREPHASNVIWYEKLKQKIESELAREG